MEDVRPYDRLLAILDAFIDVVEGSIEDSFRIRGIQTAMLLEQATAEGSGINVSEIARQTDAPLENVRRHIAAQLEYGTLRSEADPDDDRVTRVFVTETGSQLYDTTELVRRLGLLAEDASGESPESSPPYDEIIAILLAFMRSYPGAMRVQAIKRELLIQRATMAGSGITASELARLTDTPLETVRRQLTGAAEEGRLRYVQDPDDDRKVRVMFSDPDSESQRVAVVVEYLGDVDWSKFQVSPRGE